MSTISTEKSFLKTDVSGGNAFFRWVRELLKGGLSSLKTGSGTWKDASCSEFDDDHLKTLLKEDATMTYFRILVTSPKRWVKGPTNAQADVYPKKITLCVSEGPIHWELLPTNQQMDEYVHYVQLHWIKQVIQEKRWKKPSQIILVYNNTSTWKHRQSCPLRLQIKSCVAPSIFFESFSNRYSPFSFIYQFRRLRLRTQNWKISSGQV